jgi:methionine synthase I (cobalamin-dependent)
MSGDEDDDGAEPGGRDRSHRGPRCCRTGRELGRSLQDTAQLVTEFRQAGSSHPLWIKPNAGVPRVTANGVVYPEDPASFAEQVGEFAEQGARIVGGCCGSTPEHLSALARALGR